MRGRSVFDRVYLRLKDDLLAGRFLPGQRLEPARLTEELAASLTPVRDALHRLAGERLLEHSAQDGFRIPVLTEPGLRALYRFQQALLLLAADTMAGDRASPPAIDIATSFIGLAERSVLSELAPVLRNTMERLASVRTVEQSVPALSGYDGAVLIAACTASDKPQLKREIKHYHRWRIMHVEALVLAVTARCTSPRNNRLINDV